MHLAIWSRVSIKPTKKKRRYSHTYQSVSSLAILTIQYIQLPVFHTFASTHDIYRQFSLVCAQITIHSHWTIRHRSSHHHHLSSINNSSTNSVINHHHFLSKISVLKCRPAPNLTCRNPRRSTLTRLTSTIWIMMMITMISMIIRWVFVDKILFGF